ncbi:MAG: acyl-CoA thioesterase [Clostridia bacterium]|nr:acyl-CoA thioesterase [Clostridia bacterium]
MVCYKRKIMYYETDRMGITHHSNYVRIMEEARLNYLEAVGLSYAALEETGLISPVLGVNCQYKESTTYDDALEVEVRLAEYNGVRLKFAYVMKKTSSGKTVFTATSEHCFLNKEGRIIRFKNAYPEMHQTLTALVETA